jgi:hypothetical protein
MQTQSRRGYVDNRKSASGWNLRANFWERFLWLTSWVEQGQTIAAQVTALAPLASYVSDTHIPIYSSSTEEEGEGGGVTLTHGEGNVNWA